MEEESKLEQTVEQDETAEQAAEQTAEHAAAQTADAIDPGRVRLKSIIECLIFASDIPLTVERIRQVLEDLQPRKIRELVEELM